MADIIDTEVIAFLNGFIRPISEDLRKLKANIDDGLAQYSAKIAPLVSANLNEDLIEDGRAGEGVSRITKKDMVDLGSILIEIQTALDIAGKSDTIRKPTVRQLLL